VRRESRGQSYRSWWLRKILQVAMSRFGKAAKGSAVETFRRNVSTRWWALSQTLGVLYTRGGSEKVTTGDGARRAIEGV